MGAEFVKGTVVQAQPAPSASGSGASTAEQAALTTAKELFRRGVQLHSEGNVRGALDFFLESRRVYASSQNTINAALCLEKLGRFDEAIVLYEDALQRFSTQMSETNRTGTVSVIARLKNQVTMLTVDSTNGSTVLLDGKVVAKIPQKSPLAVLPGNHLIKVTKEGYQNAERSINLSAGQSLTLELPLERLKQLGALRIEDTNSDGATIFIDGKPAGPSPFEGNLPPGPHLVWSRAADRGSGPQRAVVLDGQTTLVRLESARLAKQVTISTNPITAKIEIDGVYVGTNQWTGALPEGSHVIVGAEDGYYLEKAQVKLGAEDSQIDIQLNLRIDHTHPRWPKTFSIHPYLALQAGYSVADRFSGLYEQSCVTQCGQMAQGPNFGAKVGVELGVPIAFEAALAYTSLSTQKTRGYTNIVATNDGDFAANYRYSDDLLVRGILATIGISYRGRLGKHYWLRPALSAGLFFSRSSDTIVGNVRVGSQTSRTVTEQAQDQEKTSTPFVFQPSLWFGRAVGPLFFELGVTQTFVLKQGPIQERGVTSVPPNCSEASLQTPGCLPARQILSDERVFQAFSFWTPSLALGYRY